LPGQRHVRSIEIDRRNAGGVGDEVTQRVAAARRDRDDMVVGAKVERLHVYDRIFPNLWINEAPKGESE
jgi:hypothetical protein